jgi:hypothetical protein
LDGVTALSFDKRAVGEKENIMVKATMIYALTFLILILVLSSLALHLESFIRHDFSLLPGQLSFPTVLLPIAVVKGHGISLGLIVAAGVAAGLHQILFRRFVVERWGWVTDE